MKHKSIIESFSPDQAQATTTTKSVLNVWLNIRLKLNTMWKKMRKTKLTTNFENKTSPWNMLLFYSQTNSVT